MKSSRAGGSADHERRRSSVSSIAAALFALTVAACGSESTTTLETPDPSGTTSPAATEATPTTETTTTATAVTTATTTETTTTVTDETTSTSTTTTTTSTAPTTVVEDVPAGWSALDPASVSSKAFPPCCGDTWHGDVSPALAPTGDDLADGPYFAETRWADDPTQPLQLEVFRFEQCALLPQFACEPAPDAYVPDELGVDVSESRPLTVALDDDVLAVVVGWDTAAVDGPTFVVEEADGAALAALATELDEAYREVFADRFVAGEDPDAIVADVLANPAGGFTEGIGTYTAFTFTPESGPPLLFQAVFPYVDDQQRVAGRGTDVLAIRSIDIVDGRVTLYVYAAFVP